MKLKTIKSSRVSRYCTEAWCVLRLILLSVLMLPCVSWSQNADTQLPMDYAAENTAGKATGEAVDKAVSEVAEQAAEKAIEKATEDNVAREEITGQRPDAWWKPTKVHFLVFVIDIDSIDDANQNFEGNVFIRLRWQDKRLATTTGTTRQMPLKDVWNPRVLLANRQGLVSKSLPEVVQVKPDGTVLYYQRYSGKLSQPLELQDFPMDRHTFTIQFITVGHSEEELKILPDQLKGYSGGGMATTLSLPDWEILGHEALPLIYSPLDMIRVPGFGLRFEAKRYVSYYLWQLLLPLAVVVVMSWAAFWIGREHVGVRIGVATSSILTLIAHRFVLASLLPRLPYMTRLDYFIVGSTLLVFLALLLVVVAGYFTTRSRVVAAQRVDMFSRFAFPATFAALLGWFFSGLSN
jgi:hypothetical protein